MTVMDPSNQRQEVARLMYERDRDAVTHIRDSPCSQNFPAMPIWRDARATDPEGGSQRYGVKENTTGDLLLGIPPSPTSRSDTRTQRDETTGHRKPFTHLVLLARLLPGICRGGVHDVPLTRRERLEWRSTSAGVWGHAGVSRAIVLSDYRVRRGEYDH